MPCGCFKLLNLGQFFQQRLTDRSQSREQWPWDGARLPRSVGGDGRSHPATVAYEDELPISRILFERK